MFIAQGPDPFYEFFRCRIDTSLSLDGLHDDRTCLTVNQLLHAVQVIEISEADSRYKGLKGLLVVGIAGDGQCAQAPSMEGMVHGNDFPGHVRLRVLAAVAAVSHGFMKFVIVIALCNLKSPLNGLGTAVCEKYLIHMGYLKQLLAGLNGGLVVEQIGDMGQLVKLFLHGLCILLIPIAQRHDRNASAKIQILVSLCIVKLHSLPMVKHHREPVVHLIKGLFCPFHQLFISHDNTSRLLRNYR